ncbi:MAG TPA: hypothetical protein VF570_21205 [Pyrinomonadaceae bacterium]|jgi:hypothetical protein
MTDESGAKSREPFLGTWEKVTRNECGEKYPEQLQFTERGLYYGKSEETAESRYHTVWDVGRFEPKDSRHVKLSTSNDAEIVYGFSASPDTLIFKDPDGCELTYRRVGPAGATPGASKS